MSSRDGRTAFASGGSPSRVPRQTTVVSGVAGGVQGRLALPPQGIAGSSVGGAVVLGSWSPRVQDDRATSRAGSVLTVVGSGTRRGSAGSGSARGSDGDGRDSQTVV